MSYLVDVRTTPLRRWPVHATLYRLHDGRIGEYVRAAYGFSRQDALNNLVTPDGATIVTEVQMVAVRCPHCGHDIRAAFRWAFIQYRCAECNKVFFLEVVGDEYTITPLAELVKVDL